MDEDTIKDEISLLKERLQCLENKLDGLKYKEHSLSNNELTKYSRQMIVPNIGVEGQEKLKKASVLIVGCGGLGCPAAQYLAGSGIGRIGLVDYDDVEESNLHRQILHTEKTIGQSKVESVANALKNLNSEVTTVTYPVQIDSSNAAEIVEKFDIVIDATDNVPTRYLLNDVCVFLKRPLVSGSSIKMEGQLTVYNYEGGPCYRCLYPQPPPPETVSNCGDVGVLGPVPGVIGVLQALQAIHIILRNNEGVLSGKLLLFDAAQFRFTNIKLRMKKDDCSICGKNPTVTKLLDYEQFCGSKANDKNPNLNILNKSQRITPKELLENMVGGEPKIIDVRSPAEFEMCRLPGSVNIPLDDIKKGQIDSIDKTKTLVVLCRRGNDSQIGAKILSERFQDATICDLKGGLHAWAKDVDPNFPVY